MHTRANEQFERIRTGTQRPPRQVGLTGFVVLEGINPETPKLALILPTKDSGMQDDTTTETLKLANCSQR